MSSEPTPVERTVEPPHPFVAALLRGEGVDPSDVNLTIHSKDEMLTHALEENGGSPDRALASYFQTGLGILSALRQLAAWRFGSFQQVGKLLDFASGYGRITRFLVREHAANETWVSDIYADAMEFQSREFGVHALPSATRPEEFRCNETFDCIFVTSLFTHLPQSTFVPWLSRLLRLLAPGGMMVFSVHDESLVGPKYRVPGKGILFQQMSESRTLDPQEYGTTIVSEMFVNGALHDTAPGCSWTRVARGLMNWQDLYVVVNAPDFDFSDLVLDPGPEGFLERFRLTEDRGVELSGWAVDRRKGTRLETVQVHLNGKLLDECRHFGPRADVVEHFANDEYLTSGWGCAAYLEPSVSDAFDTLSVKAISSRNISTVLYLGTIESALRRMTAIDVKSLSQRVAGLEEANETLRNTLKANLDSEGALIAARRSIAALETRIAVMERSRFWKARNLWVRLKGLVRRTIPSRNA